MDDAGTLFPADEPEIPGAAPVVAAGTDAATAADDPGIASDSTEAGEASPTLDEMVARLHEPEPAAVIDPGPDPDASTDDAPGADVADEADAEADEAIAGTDTEPATDAPEGTVEGSSPEADAGGEAAPDDAPAAAEAVVEPEPGSAGGPTPALRMWARAPLWASSTAFAVFVAVLVGVLWPIAPTAFTTDPRYRLLVLGGAGFVLIDLVTGCAAWLYARSLAVDDEKTGLARTLWTRALAWTAGGVALWWIGFVLLDLRHAGVLG